MTNPLKNTFLELADFIERSSTRKDFAFDMGEWVKVVGDDNDITPPITEFVPHFCGTAACIAGSYALMKVPLEEALEDIGDIFIDKCKNAGMEYYVVSAITEPDINIEYVEIKVESATYLLRTLAKMNIEDINEDTVNDLWEKSIIKYGKREPLECKKDRTSYDELEILL